LYSAAALFRAFARRPLVPPPAQRTRTLVSSVIVFCAASTPAFSRIASALAVLKFAATFSFNSSLALPERSSSRICSS